MRSEQLSQVAASLCLPFKVALRRARLKDGRVADRVTGGNP